MKRTGRIISLFLLVMIMASSFCFAETPLKLEKTYPENGYKNAAIENFGIKLFFNKPINNKEFISENEKCFVLKDDKGKKVPLLVVHSDKEEKMVLVLADMTNKKAKIRENTEYKLTISGDFTATDGTTLGKDTTIKVKTLNQSKSQMVNMVLMVVMFGAIMIFGMKTDQSKEKEEKEEKVNPYKVAKETGRSVEEIVEKDMKKKEKRAAEEKRKEEKMQKIRSELDKELEAENRDPNRKHVKAPHTVSEGGSTYITGRKEAALEARRKGTTNPKKKHKKNKKK